MYFIFKSLTRWKIEKNEKGGQSCGWGCEPEGVWVYEKKKYRNRKCGVMNERLGWDLLIKIKKKRQFMFCNFKRQNL
jgi:hypothetical protein